jgi:hypothetical protein
MVNLLIYLADQLLRGCQSADNQFLASQNQETEGFSVHGSQLLEIGAGVAQIQLFVRTSLRLLLSVDQSDLLLGGFSFLSLLVVLQTSGLLGHLQTLLYFPFVLDYITFLSVVLYTLFTLVLSRHQGGVFYYCGLSILCLPFVPLRQKGGVYV